MKATEGMKTILAFIIGVALGFTSAVAVQSLLDAGARSKAKRTAADCRTISAALEQYRAVNGHYPPFDGAIEHLKPYLVPRYIRVLPTHDMSGQPLLVVLNGAEAAVVATGRYGCVIQAGKPAIQPAW